MADELTRRFLPGTYVHVVDYWGTDDGTRAFEAAAKIVDVDEKNETILMVLYGDSYQRYSFKDYGRIVFDTREEAIKVALGLPNPGMTIYQVIANRVYKKRVEGIGGRSTEGTYDLIVHLNKGESVSIKEIGQTLFYYESDARESIKY